MLDKLCRGESGRILRSVSPPAGEAASELRALPRRPRRADPRLATRPRDRAPPARGAAAASPRIAGTLLAILAVFAAITGLAVVAQRKSVRATHAAQSQALASLAEADLSTAPQNALAEAVRAVEASRTQGAGTALRRAVLANPLAYVIPSDASPPPSYNDLASANEALAFSPDGRLLLGLTRDGAVHLWRAADGRAILAHPGDTIAGVGFAGARPLALVTGAGAARILDLTADRPVGAARFAGTIFDGPGNSRLALRDGRVVHLRPKRTVTVSPWTTSAVVRKSGSGAVVRTIPGFGNLRTFSSSRSSRIVTEKTNFVPGAAFSPDGRLLAVANADGIVRVWSLATQELVMSFRAGWANALAFAPRGGLLAAMTWDGSVLVAHTTVGAVLPGLSFAIAPGGRLIATELQSAEAVWTLDGRLVRVLRPPTNCASRVAAVAFSGDGTTIAVGAEPAEGFSYLCVPAPRYGTGMWRLGQRAPVWKHWFGSRGSPVLALGPRGALAVNGGRVWRTASDASVAGLAGTLALSHDGRRALLVRGRTATLVQVPSADPIARLDDAAPRVTPCSARTIAVCSACARAYSPSGTPRQAGASHSSDIKARRWTPTRSARAGGSCS